MPLERSANTWRTKNTLWKKWLDFAKADKIDPLSGSEASLLRYLGWLYEDNSVSGRSVCQYLSAVTTSHVRIGIELSLSPLVQMAVAAYKQANLDRKELLDPDSKKGRRALPSTVARSIFNASMEAQDSDIGFIRSATAVLVSFDFFERGEAGSALLLENIHVN